MGLFSKLFGEAAGKAAQDMINSLGNAAKEAQKNQGTSNTANSSGNTFYGNQTAQTAQAEESGPSGFSWGPNMPAEENQFNFNGAYHVYFENIFKENFSDCTVEKINDRGVYVFNFTRGGQKALVVELLTQNSGRYKLRNECRKSGTPYLRYYVDHDGWWNTKAYVIERTRKALG